MTHEEQAAIIIDSLDRDYTNLDGTWTDRDKAITFVSAALRQEHEGMRAALKDALTDWKHVINEFEVRVDPLDDEDVVWLDGHKFRHEQAWHALAKVQR